MHRLSKILVPAGLVAVAIAAATAPAAAQRSGVEIWSQTCGRCHRPQPANRYTADAWATIMAQMQIYARLTDNETNAILEFLQSAAKRVAASESGAAATVVAEADVTPVGGAADTTGARAQNPGAQQGAVVRYMKALASRRHP